MGTPLGEPAGDIVARPVPRRVVAPPERALLHYLARHALERPYHKGLTDIRLLVFWREPCRVWLSGLFLRPAAGLLLAVCRGRRGRRRRLIVVLGGAMSFQTVFELLLIYGWLVKRLPPAPVWQAQPADAAHG